MKYLFTIIILLLFIGCADKNAFSKFKMDTDEELSASSIQSSKIKSKKQTEGIVSVIYLNEVYPEKYFDKEYFFVSLYIKRKKDIHINFMLNKKQPINIKKLPSHNQFSNLVGAKEKWKKHYLVVFKKEKSTTLTIVFQNGQFFSDPLVYKKDQL